MTAPRVPSLRLDAILSHAREPAFVLGPDLRVVGVNRAFEDLTGQPADRLVGLSCRGDVGGRGAEPPADLAELAAAIHPPPEAIAGRPSGGACPIGGGRGDGDRPWRRVEFWPFHDGEGDLLGLFGLVRPPETPAHAPESESWGLRGELLALRDRLARRHGVDTLIGRGPAHRRLLDGVRAASASGVPALIVGEPGTGRRTVARSIHALGPDDRGPLLPFDPAALPPEVLSRELFGEPGEVDDRGRAGRLAVPEGSTVLIPDVIDLPRDLQAAIASALDGRVRLLATTAEDPDTALRSDRLHVDLYYALTTLVLRLPPLRERLGDLPLLAQGFLERANRRGAIRRDGFVPEAVDALLAYDWPGNLRELARVVDAAHDSGTGPRVERADLPAAILGQRGGAYLPPPPPPPTPLDDRLTQVERRLIEQSLVAARQNKSRAAELLGISRPRLYRRLKELGIADEPESPGEDGTA